MTDKETLNETEFFIRRATKPEQTQVVTRRLPSAVPKSQLSILHWGSSGQARPASHDLVTSGRLFDQKLDILLEHVAVCDQTASFPSYRAKYSVFPE